VKEHPVEAAETTKRGFEVYRKHLWPEEKKAFLNLLTKLSPQSTRIQLKDAHS